MHMLLQPTPAGLQQPPPPAGRVGGKRRVLSPDAAGMQRLTLGRAQKKLKLEGSGLGLAWQPISAAKPPLAPSAAMPATTAVSRGVALTCSPTKVGLAQHLVDSLKQIKKRRVSLRIQAQTHPGLFPTAPISIADSTPCPSSHNTMPGDAHSQQPTSHASSDGSGKSVVSEEMAQSPQARGPSLRLTPACSLAQENGASGCLYSGFFDQEASMLGGDLHENRPGDVNPSLSLGRQVLGKRPVPGQCGFRSQKRLRF